MVDQKASSDEACTKKQKAQYINSVKVATEKMQRQNKASLAEITRQQSTSVMMKSRPTRILPIFYVTGPLTSEREIKLDVTEMNMLRRRMVQREKQILRKENSRYFSQPVSWPRRTD